MLLCKEEDPESPSQQMLYSLLMPDKTGSTHGHLYLQQQGVVEHHKVSGPPSSPPQVEVLMSPTQTAATCANPTYNTNSASNISPALTNAIPLTPSSATCLQAALHHRMTGMFPRCTGESGTKTIPAQCVQAGLGHWEAGLLHGLSQTCLPSPKTLQTAVWTLDRTKSLWDRLQEEDAGGL